MELECRSIGAGLPVEELVLPSLSRLGMLEFSFSSCQENHFMLCTSGNKTGNSLGNVVIQGCILLNPAAVALERLEHEAVTPFLRNLLCEAGFFMVF